MDNGLPVPHVLLVMEQQGPEAVCVDSDHFNGVYFRVGTKITGTLEATEGGQCDSSPLGPYEAREYAHQYNVGFEDLLAIIIALCDTKIHIAGDEYKHIEKIHAIKIFRTFTGFGLKASKDWIDFCYDWD